MSKNITANTPVGDRVIPEEIRPAIGEFVSTIGRIPTLLCAILYGSAARGELHRKSDIDVFLLFDTEYNPELSEESLLASQIATEAETRVNCPYSFSFVLSNVQELGGMDSDYFWEVAKDGIVVWCRPAWVLPARSLPLAPHSIITYQLNGLAGEDKRAIEGLIRGRCRHLADGVVLAPAREAEEILALLRVRGATVTESRIWYYRE